MFTEFIYLINSVYLKTQFGAGGIRLVRQT